MHTKIKVLVILLLLSAQVFGKGTEGGHGKRKFANRQRRQQQQQQQQRRPRTAKNQQKTIYRENCEIQTEVDLSGCNFSPSIEVYNDLKSRLDALAYEKGYSTFSGGGPFKLVFRQTHDYCFNFGDKPDPKAIWITTRASYGFTENGQGVLNKPLTVGRTYLPRQDWTYKAMHDRALRKLRKKIPLCVEIQN